VNGAKSADLKQLMGSLIIRMQSGEDKVAIQGGFSIPHDLRANLTAGELVIEGSNGQVNIGGNLSVRTGRQGHLTIRNEVRIGGETSVVAGGDVNYLSGHATLPDFASARFNNSLNINNPYFPIVPGAGYVYHTEGVDDETGEPVTQENPVDVLSATRTDSGREGAGGR